MTTPHQQIVRHVIVALDELLAAVALIGTQDANHPDDALDDALAASADVKEARVAVHVGLQALRDLAVGDDVVFAMEEAANALAARCAEVAFGLGQRCR